MRALLLFVAALAVLACDPDEQPPPPAASASATPTLRATPQSTVPPAPTGTPTPQEFTFELMPADDVEWRVVEGDPRETGNLGPSLAYRVSTGEMWALLDADGRPFPLLESAHLGEHRLIAHGRLDSLRPTRRFILLDPNTGEAQEFSAPVSSVWWGDEPQTLVVQLREPVVAKDGSRIQEGRYLADLRTGRAVEMLQDAAVHGTSCQKAPP